MIALISTAPAAASLESFARGWSSGEAKSTTASTAVFTSSKEITSANRIRQIIHSNFVI